MLFRQFGFIVVFFVFVGGHFQAFADSMGIPANKICLLKTTLCFDKTGSKPQLKLAHLKKSAKPPKPSSLIKEYTKQIKLLDKQIASAIHSKKSKKVIDKLVKSRTLYKRKRWFVQQSQKSFTSYTPLITGSDPASPIDAATLVKNAAGYFEIKLLGANFFGTDTDTSTPVTHVFIQFGGAILEYPASFLGASTLVLLAPALPLGSTNVIIWAVNEFSEGDLSGALVSSPFSLETYNAGLDGGSPPPNCDTDGDGYFSPACGGTDCDDLNSGVHPGAKEVCGDGLDNDCSGGDSQCPAASFSYPLTVYETIPHGESATARLNDSVTFGFPLPEGQLQDLNTLKIEGAPAAQFTSLAKWPDGSQRWVLLDFAVPALSAGQKDTQSFSLTNGGSGDYGGSPLCSQSNGVISVNTGVMTAEIKQKNFNVFDKVTIGSSALVVPGNVGRVHYRNELGVDFSSNTSDATKFTILQNGPVRCQVLVEGVLGASAVRYRLIYDFFQSKAFANLSAALINDDFNSPTHKFVKGGAQVVVGTTLSGTGLSTEFADGTGNAFSKSLPVGQTLEISNWYSSAHMTSDKTLTGFDFTNYFGYGVSLLNSGTGQISSVVVPRTAAAGVPTYHWLTLKQGALGAQLINRYGPYYYPNGLSSASDGSLSADLFAPDYPGQATLLWRTGQNREFRVDFQPSGDAKTVARQFTNKLIAIPSDPHHFGLTSSFSPFELTSLSATELQSFYSRPDIHITRPVCTNMSDPGYKGTWPGLNTGLTILRLIATGLTGGGWSNSTEANTTSFTFTAGAIGNYPYAEQLAMYRASTDVRFIRNLNITDLNNKTQQNQYNMAATNNSAVSGEIYGANAEHNWAPQLISIFYYLTGREEYRQGLEGLYYWLRMNGYQKVINYTRALGQQLMGHARILQYLQGSSDPRFSEYNAWLHDFLMNTVLFAVAKPNYGPYVSNTCMNNQCNGYYIQDSGWFAGPGESFDQSNPSLPPEIQQFNLPIDNGWHSAGGSGNGLDECEDGDRAFMLIQRLAAGFMELFGFLKLVDENDPVLDPLAKRIMDLARHAVGNTVGGGAYALDFVNPANSHLMYRFCPYNNIKNTASDNAYVVASLFSFAAKLTTSAAKSDFYQNAAINQILALEKDPNGSQMLCYREFDPAIQYVIKSFVDSGASYHPASFPLGSAVP